MAATSKPSVSGSAIAGMAASASRISTIYQRIYSIRFRAARFRTRHLQNGPSSIPRLQAWAPAPAHFLAGVGSIDASGFRLRQFFLRDYGEEPSLLWRLAEYLSQFDALITYNGRTFDQPLLEGRYRLARTPHPFTRLPHLDLLFGARRLWKLRLDSCRLIDLETRILGVERQGDLPGDLIPYYYFEFQRTHQALRLVPIFHHNALDILTLACLTPIVAGVFRSPEEAGLRHGADLIGLSRWLRDAGRNAEALGLLRRAVGMGLPDPLLFRTLWDIGLEERRRGAIEAALEVWRDLAGARNSFRVRALVELAKHYERREKNYAAALEATLEALSFGESPGLRSREVRLRKRILATDGHGCTQIKQET